MSGQSLIGQLAVDLFMETAAFEEGATQAKRHLRKLEKDFAAIGAGFVDLGQKLTLGLTLPLAGFAAISVKAAMESRDAVAQVDSAIKSMGNAAGRTSAQLQDMAGGLMSASLYDDDEILRKVTANLLTFGNVSGTVFDRAQQAAVDLSARLGQDLQSSAIQLGKALNDPVKGVTALAKVGVSFTAEQKELIKSLAESGKVAQAQGLILAELERQYGGAAKAAREANPLASLQQSWAEFQETVGDELLKVLPNLASALERVLSAFNTLSPGMQQAVIIAGGLAAALGPVLIGVGALVQTFAPLLGVLQMVAAEGGLLVAAQAGFAGLAAALGPIVAIAAAVAAAGYAIYANWDKIGPALEALWQQVETTLGPPLRELIDAVSAAFSELWNGPLGSMIGQAVSALVDLQLIYMKTFGPVVLAVIKGLIVGLTEFFRFIGDGVHMVSALLTGDWQTAFVAAHGIVNRLFFGMPDFVIGLMAKLVNGVRHWIGELGKVLHLAIAPVKAVEMAFFHLYDAVVGHSYVPDMVDGIAAQMSRLDAVMVDPAKKATKKAGEAFRALAEEVRPLLDRLFPEAAALNALRADQALIGKAQAGGAIDAGQADEARRRLALEGRSSGLEALMADWNQPIDGLEQMSGAILEVTKAGDVLVSKAGAVKVQVVESFEDLATGTLDSLRNLGNSIKSGGFLDIFTSVLDLLLQLGGIGVFGSKIQTNLKTANFGGFRANGGPVVPGKTYMVGENGPEWFTPGAAGGKITPMAGDGGSTVRIVPSPYFDAVVDGRAARVAGPMAAASGNFARGAAAGDMAQRARRRIPG